MARYVIISIVSIILNIFINGAMRIIRVSFLTFNGVFMGLMYFDSCLQESALV